MRNSFLSFISIVCLSITANLSVAGDIAQYPLFLALQAEPKVMFNMSNDHQLSIKAYTDYTDLNKDGIIDTSYTDSIDYYGYFESGQCYRYDVVDKQFKPYAYSAGANGHSCLGNNDWSGNFLNWATMTRMDVIRKVLYGGLRSTDKNGKTVLERAYLPNDVHAFSKVFSTSSKGVMKQFTPYGKTNISLCNVTFDNDPNAQLSGKVSTLSSPPLLRISKRKYPSWAAKNGSQCNFDSSSAPPSADRLENPDLVVRVAVCQPSFIGENCAIYPNGNSKPEGILQQNSGENSKRINFGLMTGSYQKNKSGGVLRKNILPMLGNGNFDDEYSATTGVFSYLDQSLNNRVDYAKGIIHSLDSLRIAGWNQSRNQHKYGCDYPGKLTINNGECVDWGNPLSEIYLESLRYLSGKDKAKTAFNANDSAYITDLKSASWTDPIGEQYWCAKLSTITISTGLNSFDTDQLNNDIGLNPQVWVDKVGAAEGISGQYLVGQGSGASDGQCTAKNVNSLNDVKGICPDVPSLQGGYHLAGLAYYAHTNDIRTDRKNKQTVDSYGIALAESLPKFDIPIDGKVISILPTCQARNNSSTAWRTCSLADLKVTKLNAAGTKGEFDIIWEDSSWGNDYDLDGVSHISFCAENKCASNPGNGKIRIEASIREVGAGHGLRFGYVVTGTTEDGVYTPVHRPAGHANFSYTTTPLPQYIDEKTFTTGLSAAKQLHNPLWYMSKYGGFIESAENSNQLPDLKKEWDALPKDNPDGRPDSYFKATNPAELQKSISQVFTSIGSHKPTAASLQSNSSSLGANSKIYQARFDSENWSGELLAYSLSAKSGKKVNPQLWDAAERIPEPSQRKIFTTDLDAGLPVIFQYDKLGATQKALLSLEDVQYLRGDRTNENTTYRKRGNALGDIVNSSPLYAGQENFNYSNIPGYGDYLKGTEKWQKGVRKHMLYAGANDGMLHGFIANGDTDADCDITTTQCDGEEAMAFIPKAMYPKIKDLTSRDYQHQFFVDGALSYNDAFISYTNSQPERWGSVLIGMLGAGGKGVFALDISNPLEFSKTDVLWDIESTDTGMEDLGYTFGKASIVKMANGKWVAVIANGYNSTNHKAALYLLDLETGAVIKKIMAGNQGNATKPNGLSTPAVIDINNDNVVDSIYAGDLYGNIWKFDVSSPYISNWKVATDSTGDSSALFSACNAPLASCTTDKLQPITIKPEIIKTSAGELMVLFGTGKYFEVEDKNNTSFINSYYGILDKSNNITGSIKTLKSELQQQSIISLDSQANSTFNAGYRITTNHTNPDALGWYLDFDDSAYLGERVIVDSLIYNDSVIFTTSIPDSGACSQGGVSFLMRLDLKTGTNLVNGSFDFNNDGVIDQNDKVKTDNNGDGIIDAKDNSIVASGRLSNVGMTNTPKIIGNKLYIAGSSGDDESINIEGGLKPGRISWSQLK